MINCVVLERSTLWQTIGVIKPEMEHLSFERWPLSGKSVLTLLRKTALHGALWTSNHIGLLPGATRCGPCWPGNHGE
jgi:hypothetical protein